MLRFRENGFFMSAAVPVDSIPNNGQRDITLPVWFDREIYCNLSLLRHEHVEVEITLREGTDPEGPLLFRTVFNVLMSCFTGCILEKCPSRVLNGDLPSNSNIPPKWNVLLFGLAGSGKSTLANSFLTLLRNDLHISLQAAAGGGLGHCTVEYKAIDTAQLAQFPCNIWDAWGLDARSRDYLGVFAQMMRGELPSGWNMDRRANNPSGGVMSQYREALQQIQDPWHRAIHAVLFCMPATSLALAGGDKFTDVVQEAYSTIKDWNPLIVITHADMFSEDYARDPVRALEDLEAWRLAHADFSKLASDQLHPLERLRQQARALVHVPESRIKFAANYAGSSLNRNLAYDLQNARVLSAALDSARDNFPQALAKVMSLPVAPVPV